MTLRIENDQAAWISAKRVYPLHTGFLALLIVVASYLAAKLGGTLVLPPIQVSALWPGCALLASGLLLLPRRTWPALIPAGLAGFVLHDLQTGFAPSTIAHYILADTIEILIVVLGLRYFFEGVPRLCTLKALAKYCLIAVLIAPFIGSFVGAFAIPGHYFTAWRIFFFSEAIAFLTLTPALLSSAIPNSGPNKKFSESKLEAAALVSALVLLACVTFFFSWRTPPVSLIYSFVPVLVWAALRFGSKGVSASVMIIAFASTWGSIHGHGPFIGSDPLHNVLSLQLFLVFAAGPFMVLAVLVEEREQSRLVERNFSGRLISAQERERTRIGRELHDDISQRLALLTMEVVCASRSVSGSAEATKDLEQIRQHCSDLARDVQTLSHQLHHSKLDFLGLAVALRGCCRDFAKLYNVKIDFRDQNVPTNLSKGTSLCLFRVAQEALHNAVKYSGGEEFTVELSATANEVQLAVRDAGAGFDVHGVMTGSGLGLASMHERVRIADGRFFVESKPRERDQDCCFCTFA